MQSQNPQVEIQRTCALKNVAFRRKKALGRQVHEHIHTREKNIRMCVTRLSVNMVNMEVAQMNKLG